MPNTHRRAALERRAQIARDAADGLIASLRDDGMKALVRAYSRNFADDALTFFLLHRPEPVHEERWLDETERLIALSEGELVRLRGEIDRSGGPDKVQTIG